MKILRRMDLGYSCSFEARGETNEKGLKEGMEHARKVHGMKPRDVTPTEVAEIKAVMKDL